MLVALALTALPASGAAQTELNIFPHGQHQPGAQWASAPGMLPAGVQALMYDRLTPLGRHISDATLQPSADGTGYFKSARLLAADDPSLITDETIASGELRARIRRDAYGVPHIYSSTDAGVIFGAGYVMAQDRSLVLDQGRDNRIASAIDMPGAPASSSCSGSTTTSRRRACGGRPCAGRPAPCAGPAPPAGRCCATSTRSCSASTGGTPRTSPTRARSTAATCTLSTRSRASSSARAAATRSRTRCSTTPPANASGPAAARGSTRTCGSATIPRRRPRRAAAHATRRACPCAARAGWCGSRTAASGRPASSCRAVTGRRPPPRRRPRRRTRCSSPATAPRAGGRSSSAARRSATTTPA